MTKGGQKRYQQWAYHIAYWKNGSVVAGEWLYIPKKKLDRVIELERQKAPVEEIREFLKRKAA